VTYTWHPANTLPTPGTPLLLELTDGTVIEGTRPQCVASRNQDDLGYVDNLGKPVVVVRWAHA
jgi:hypothetical protein